MTTTALDKLSKVLALADSGHDGEAMAALRAARTMLNSDGVNLSEVLKDALAENRYVQVRGGVVNSLQRDVVQLQMQVARLQHQLREQQQETQHWKKMADDNARKFRSATSDKDRWREKVAETTRRLADIAKSLENEG